MFILKITNLKTNQAQESDFATIEECNAHFEKYKAEGFWGKEEQTIVQASYVIHHDEIPEVRDPQNNNIITKGIAAYDELIPSSTEVILCEYTKEIIDNTIVDAKNAIKLQIDALEAQITSRRIRESLLSGDHSFLQSIDAQIATLRLQLV